MSLKNARQEAIARAENTVAIAVQLGELLPITWRAIFHGLFRPTLASWNSAKEFEGLRQQLRALFFTVREAMERAQRIAESLQLLNGRKPEGMDRLAVLIEDAGRLEEAVFRDWPSFAEPLQSSCNAADSLPVDASLAASSFAAATGWHLVLALPFPGDKTRD